MSTRILAVVFGAAALAGCQRSPATDSEPAGSAAAAKSAALPAGVLDAQQALDHLDTRVAVPLLPPVPSPAMGHLRTKSERCLEFSLREPLVRSARR